MNVIKKWKGYCDGSAVLAWLTITVTGVWLIMAIGTLFHFDRSLASLLTLPSHAEIFLTRPWTLVTYMTIHFDILHMLFNAAWLYWFGRILLITLSEKHLAYYFIGGGITGGIFFLIASALGSGSGWLCGASASVIAVMCGAAIRLPDHRINLLLIGSVKLKWIAIACCVLTFLGGGGNQTAHIGGLVWGVATALLIKTGYDPTERLKGFSLRSRTTHKTGQRRRNPAKVADALQKHRNDMERLDQLLDKIRISGYGSLSNRERKELDRLSKRIKNN